MMLQLLQSESEDELLESLELLTLESLEDEEYDKKRLLTCCFMNLSIERLNFFACLRFIFLTFFADLRCFFL